MATQKKRKFAIGGVTEEDLSAANAEQDPIAALNARKGWTDTEEAPAPAPAPARKMSFKEAFAQARKGGGKTFEWNGKKYTTEMAGASKPAAKVTDTGDDMARMKARAPVAAAKPKYETRADALYRRNREEAAARGSAEDRAAARVTKGREMAAAIKSPGEYKKGGSVKGWGIARGARKAKIR